MYMYIDNCTKSDVRGDFLQPSYEQLTPATVDIDKLWWYDIPEANKKQWKSENCNICLMSLFIGIIEGYNTVNAPVELAVLFVVRSNWNYVGTPLLKINMCRYQTMHVKDDNIIIKMSITLHSQFSLTQTF